jgi:hypothetical protein
LQASTAGKIFCCAFFVKVLPPNQDVKKLPESLDQKNHQLEHKQPI